jgi:hypothetical protein
MTPGALPADRANRERGDSDVIARPPLIVNIGMAAGPLRASADDHYARAEQAA